MRKASTFSCAIEAPKWTNPRRTSSTTTRPPPLIRQMEKKDQFVNNLVDSAKCMVEVIWPLAACDRHNLPLRTYIQEILKRTKTSFSTLQVALYYLLLIRTSIPTFDFTREQPRDMAAIRGFQCGRRMFLAAIILASKYLQDRNYTSNAWSKITSLPVNEINENEMEFLSAIDWQLHMTETKFDRWQNILLKYSQPSFIERWKEAVKVLRPALDNLPPLSVSQSIRIDTSCAPLVTSLPSPMTPYTPTAFTPVVHGQSSPFGAYSPAISTTQGCYERPTPLQPPYAPHMGRLNTPRFNENVGSICSTPAVGSTNRSSMCSAMSYAHNAAMARSCTDFVAPIRPFGHAFPFPAINRSTSSSPESTMSDSSSQASRSSSVSSASSIPMLEASPYRLAHIAQANRFKAQFVAPDQITESPEQIVMDHARSPSPSEFENVTRKRARASIDRSYVDVVEESPAAASTRAMLRVAIAQKVESPLPHYVSPVAMQVSSLLTTSGLPAAKRPRLEREYAQNIDRFCRPQGGPGMWTHIL